MADALIGIAPDSNTVNRLAKYAVMKLNLGKVECVSPLPSYSNHNYYVHAEQGDFLLRLHRKAKQLQDVIREHNIALHVRSHGIRTPVVLETFSWNNHLTSAYEWIDGMPLANQKKIVRAQARQAGEYLARIHIALQVLPPPAVKKQADDRQYRYRQPAPEEVLQAAYQINLPDWHCQELMLFLESAEQLRSGGPTSIEPEEIHWLHGDFTARNILLSRPEWTILDWEDAAWGDPAWDLAIGLLYLCDFPERVPDHPCTRAFLSGYSSRLVLTEAAVKRILWQACFVLAPDTNWLLACLANREIRPLSHLERDQARLDRLIPLVMQKGFQEQLPSLLLSDCFK